MALSRDTRMDRRRRALLDASVAEQAEGSGRRGSVQTNSESAGKKSAGYSQDVRQACGTRLVQLIPVRKRSFTALVTFSIGVTATLLLAHYLVYVNGKLPWYGHPLAVALDASHPQSIAAWLGSHLWLMCLGTTVLTFQLRRHKLDDYKGEYRLWFWLVITCLIASIDSTTRVSELFSQSLDRWAKINVGWSGKAVVLATLATLIGMLGLRLCTELKSVPTSLICWLVGLTSWAASAALGQEMLRLDMEIQTRVWLRAGLWLIGLTAIWIAAVAYLRHVYIEAQRRFLARGHLARRGSSVPITERVRQTIPFLKPRSSSEADGESTDESDVASGWSLRGMFRRRPKSDNNEQIASRPERRSKSKPTLAASSTQPAERTADNTNRIQPQVAPQLNQSRPVQQTAPAVAKSNNPVPAPASSAQATTAHSSAVANNRSNTKPTEETSSEKKQRGWPWSMKLWPGRGAAEDDGPEFQKLTRAEQAEERRKAAEERRLEREMANADRKAAKDAKAAQRAADKQSKREARATAASNGENREGIGKKLFKPVAAVGGALKKIKLPSLSAFKLSPPETGEEGNSTSDNRGSLRPVNPNAPLPGTTSKPLAQQVAQRSNNANYQDDDDDEDDRHLSKSERKKLRRQNRAA